MLKVVLRFLKFFPYLILFSLGTLILLLSLNSLSYHPPKKYYDFRHPEKKFYPIQDSTLYFSMKKKYGKRKILPKGFETQALTALSFYPELIDVPIHFIVEAARFPLSSRPDFISLLSFNGERKYIITISCGSLPSYKPILLAHLPFNAQIGVVGHELAHISDYLKETSLKLTATGAMYSLSADFRHRFEKRTDRMTIRHGLGFQLLDWRIYFEDLKKRKIFKSGKEFSFEEGRYLTAAEIREFLFKYK